MSHVIVPPDFFAILGAELAFFRWAGGPQNAADMSHLVMVPHPCLAFGAEQTPFFGAVVPHHIGPMAVELMIIQLLLPRRTKPTASFLTLEPGYIGVVLPFPHNHFAFLPWYSGVAIQWMFFSDVCFEGNHVGGPTKLANIVGTVIPYVSETMSFL